MHNRHINNITPDQEKFVEFLAGGGVRRESDIEHVKIFSSLFENPRSGEGWTFPLPFWSTLFSLLERVRKHMKSVRSVNPRVRKPFFVSKIGSKLF